jgi:hypothetical protein
MKGLRTESRNRIPIIAAVRCGPDSAVSRVLLSIVALSTHGFLAALGGRSGFRRHGSQVRVWRVARPVTRWSVNDAPFP